MDSITSSMYTLNLGSNDKMKNTILSSSPCSPPLPSPHQFKQPGSSYYNSEQLPPPYHFLYHYPPPYFAPTFSSPFLTDSISPVMDTTTSAAPPSKITTPSSTTTDLLNHHHHESFDSEEEEEEDDALYQEHHSSCSYSSVSCISPTLSSMTDEDHGGYHDDPYSLDDQDDDLEIILTDDSFMWSENMFSANSFRNQHPSQRYEEEVDYGCLQRQLEYYFSRHNLANDIYLVSQMDIDLYVPITTIAQFHRVQHYTTDIHEIIQVLKRSPYVIVDETETRVKPNISPSMERTTVILRELPQETTEQEITDLLRELDSPPVKNIKYDFGNIWYIVFESEDDALKFFYDTRGCLFKEKPVAARMKSIPAIHNIFESIQRRHKQKQHSSSLVTFGSINDNKDRLQLDDLDKKEKLEDEKEVSTKKRRRTRRGGQKSKRKREQLAKNNKSLTTTTNTTSTINNNHNNNKNKKNNLQRRPGNKNNSTGATTTNNRRTTTTPQDPDTVTYANVVKRNKKRHH
ncbi:hypothetical protein BDA99DRAFT_514319 [Phascolomyces articulosus]|uniref:HTH La-type RNA-binding domain-containing protein n=1 Tax=Phascolomyces articulosus TaxID=60185 RepID=A0AAD5K7Q0_9FUNG|nr:hypothetical protein BDA99DRAFT_514319 [Phascolomyces articulosus]